MKVFLLILSCLPLMAQTGEVNIINGTFNVSTAGHTLPAKVVANVGALPGTCSEGEQASVTSATPGSKIYTCGPANTWTQVTGAGGGSVFTGSTAVTSAFSATPTFSLADVSVKSPIRFEPGAMTANVTAVTFTNKTAGATFYIAWLQDGTGGRTINYGASATNACQPDATAGATTTQAFQVSADGTTVNGIGCPSTTALESGPEQAAPGTPPVSTWVRWADSTNHVLSYKANGSSTVSNTVVPNAGASNQFVASIGANGVVVTAQPAFSNLSGAATTSQLPTVTLRRVCDIGVGDTSGSAITDAQLGPQKHACKIPAAATLVEIDVESDAASPSIVLGRRRCTTFTAGVCSAETKVDILSSALAVASGFGACSKTTAVTGLDGGTTCSATLQNTALLAGDWVELVSGTAGGTAKWMTVHAIYTID